MSAGDFIVRCMQKTREELFKADIAKAARQYKIPIEWARHYLITERDRSDKP